MLQGEVNNSLQINIYDLQQLINMLDQFLLPDKSSLDENIFIFYLRNMVTRP